MTNAYAVAFFLQLLLTSSPNVASLSLSEGYIVKYWLLERWGWGGGERERQRKRETASLQPAQKGAAFCLGPATDVCNRASLQIEKALYKSHTGTHTHMAAPSKQCESDSESVSFTLGYNWQEAGRGYHLSCHWAIVMGNGSSVRVCVCARICASKSIRVFVLMSVCARVCLCVTPGSRWNPMLIGWRSVGEFGADWPGAGLQLLGLARSHPWLCGWFCLLVAGCFPSLHLPTHPRITPSDR